MTDRTIRALAFGFLASTALASPAFAQTPNDATPETPTDPVPAPGTNATNVTGERRSSRPRATGRFRIRPRSSSPRTKREENLQDVPISVQAIGTRRLDQLNISNFEDYTKQLPSVSFQTFAAGLHDGLHARRRDGRRRQPFGLASRRSASIWTSSRSRRSAARSTSTSTTSPASRASPARRARCTAHRSQAGTIRIITNKPELGVTSGRIDGELNKVAHGGMGGSLEGMINLPIGDSIAFRAVAFYQRDAGYIDNILGSRTYCGDPIFEDADDRRLHPRRHQRRQQRGSSRRISTIRGSMAAARRSRSTSTTTGPSLRRSCTRTQDARRVLHDPDLGDLKTERFRKEIAQGQVHAGGADNRGQDRQFRRDLRRRIHGPARLRRSATIADYADAYDAYYEYTTAASLDYLYYLRQCRKHDRPAPIHCRQQPLQEDEPGASRRVAGGEPFRVIGGAFYQAQTNDINQEYHVDNLGRRPVGQRLPWHPVADPAEAQGQGLCDVRRSELRRNPADHPDRGRAAVQV